MPSVSLQSLFQIQHDLTCVGIFSLDLFEIFTAMLKAAEYFRPPKFSEFSANHVVLDRALK